MKLAPLKLVLKFSTRDLMPMLKGWIALLILSTHGDPVWSNLAFAYGLHPTIPAPKIAIFLAPFSYNLYTIIQWSLFSNILR